MTRKLNSVLLALLVFIGAPFAWLVLDSRTSGETVAPVSIGRLRRLAASLPGPAPAVVHFETVGRRDVVGDLLAAGSGLRPVPFMIRAFQLVRPDGETIMIDRGISRAAAQDQRIANFDPAAQAAVERGIDDAGLDLVLAPAVHHGGREGLPPAFGSGAPSLRVTIRTGPYAVARGVVVIPTYGIAAGERMIYVRLASGRELLWAGDVAPLQQSWLERRPPARLATAFLADRDREQIGAWLRTVRVLKAQAPNLQIIAGHDAGLPPGLVKGFVRTHMPGGALPR